MKARKIKFEISKGSLRLISGMLSVVENELDEQYKLIKTTEVVQLMPVMFNYNWINKEADMLFKEVDQWKAEALRLMKLYNGKELRSNEICIVWNPMYEKQLVGAFKALEKKLNLEKNKALVQLINNKRIHIRINK